MKKLITIILILAMLLPAAALAEEKDPIVNSWYMLYDKDLYPELSSTFQNCDFIVCVYTFTKDGKIIKTENDVLNGESTPACGPCGKWEKTGSKYSYSIMGFNSGEAKVIDGMIYLQLPNDIYLRLNCMTPYDPYNDYTY